MLRFASPVGPAASNSNRSDTGRQQLVRRCCCCCTTHNPTEVNPADRRVARLIPCGTPRHAPELLLATFVYQSVSTRRAEPLRPMASSVAGVGQPHQHPAGTGGAAADCAFREAREWIEVSDAQSPRGTSPGFSCRCFAVLRSRGPGRRFPLRLSL
ncbi:uncharacterized protein ACO6RY_15108 [Pungitius sinensis]